MTLCAQSLSLADRLADISLALRPGEITAICGPNGAGKSTLLSCLAGLLKPDSGSASLDGQPLLSILPQERAQTIGYLSQSGELAWDVSVETLVGLGRLPWPGSAGRAAVDDAIAAMGLTALRLRPISHLSGGEKARVLLARVLAGEPRWLLADEPLANLDLAHAATLMGCLRAQAQAGRGVVVVLHDLAMAMNHADRVIALDRGRIAADGAPEAALSPLVIRPLWQIDAQWLGEPGARALSLGCDG